MVVMDNGQIKVDGTPRKVLSSKEVASLGIGLPKVIRLHQMLKDKGFELGEPPVSVDEFVKEVRRALKQ